MVVVSDDATKPVMEAFSARGVSCIEIGTASAGDSIKIAVGASPPCIDEKMTILRDLWEETSFRIEHRQRNPECVAQEEAGLKLRKAPEWKLTFVPEPTAAEIMSSTKKHKVAIIRNKRGKQGRSVSGWWLSGC